MTAFTNQMKIYMRDKFKTSVAIKAFVEANFGEGKKYSIYNGIEPEDQPPEEAYPIIVLGSIQGIGRGSSGRTVFAATITAGVASIEKTETPLEACDLVEYTGGILAEEFRVLLENEILSLKGVGAIINLSGETIFEDYFPFYHSTTVVTFELAQDTSGRR